MNVADTINAAPFDGILLKFVLSTKLLTAVLQFQKIHGTVYMQPHLHAHGIGVSEEAKKNILIGYFILINLSMIVG